MKRWAATTGLCACCAPNRRKGCRNSSIAGLPYARQTRPRPAARAGLGIHYVEEPEPLANPEGAAT